MNDQLALNQLLNKDFEMDLTLTEEELKAKLRQAFAWMLDNDISKMMQILYRADVNEERLKELLISRSDLPSAEVIAEEYLNRQRQKIETRKMYSA